MRILIQQKTSFEKINEELLTYESSYKTEESREMKYIPVNTIKVGSQEKKTAFRSGKFQSKYKNTPNTSNQYNKPNKLDSSQSHNIKNTMCGNCRKLGHTTANCFNPIRCNYFGKSGHRMKECRSRLRDLQVKVCEVGNIENQSHNVNTSSNSQKKNS